jgi:hypothetical protein
MTVHSIRELENELSYFPDDAEIVVRIPVSGDEILVAEIVSVEEMDGVVLINIAEEEE